MPLSVPVDLNPIVKEPPVFQDGDALPGANVAKGANNGTLSTSAPVIGAYDPESDELHVSEGSFAQDITVYDGISNNSVRTYSLGSSQGLDHEFVGAEFYNGFLYWFVNGNDQIKKIDPSNGNISTTVGNPTSGGIVDITFTENGDLIAAYLSGGDFFVETYNGFSGNDGVAVNLTGTMNAHGGGNAAVSVVNGDLVVIRTDPLVIYVYDGIGGTKLREIDLSSLGNNTNTRAVYCGSRRTIEGDDQFVIVANNNLSNANNYNAIALENEDNGVNFTGNSDKTLETDHIYSFDIVGPNTTTGPTLNDDGQGQYTIVLPGGASIPVGALTGNFDFLFDGSNYIVVSLTSELAAAIYDFQGAVKDNMTATTDPATSDDEDAGYSVRSRWYNTSTGEAFLCVDPSAGAAVWVKASLTLDELGSAATEDAANPATANTVALRDANGRAQFSDPSADADAATKGWALAAPADSTDPALAFDTWRTPNTNRPTMIVLHAKVQTDGTTDGQVRISSDESGGTTPNYIIPLILPASITAGSLSIRRNATTIIPAGGSYEISNVSDPDAQNSIEDLREFTL